MKQIIFIIFSLLSSHFGTAGEIYTKADEVCNFWNYKKNYKVSGYIEGVVNKFIYLKHGYGIAYGPTDSIFSKNGEFSFTGKLEETRMATLAVEGIRFSKGFILEKGNMTITGNIDDMNNAIVTGSKENIIDLNLKRLITPIHNENQTILKKISETKKNNDSLAFKNYSLEWEKIGRSYEKLYEDFIKQHPKSFVSLNICRNNTFGAPELANRYLSLLDKSLQKHSVYQEVKTRAEVEARIGINKPAPDFTLPSVTNDIFSLSSLKGKFVLIDFWASWCVPCRQESENLVSAYKLFSSSGLEIVSVSLDEKKDLWLKAIEKDGYSWINVSDLKGYYGNVAKLYGVSAIPKNFLLDKDGKIIAMNLMGASLHKKLNEVVKN